MPDHVSNSRPQPRRTARRTVSPDMWAVLVLIALWLLYFWRVFTPTIEDAVSLTEGDFSGQFVAFLGYQVERLSDGEIPLWNPYNLAGHPFLADTQSAVFYPPRLLTVVLVGADATPGDLYAALQTEMTLHVLLGTLLMYALVRRLTSEQTTTRTASITAGLVAAITFGYGGYLSGYPQLQLAVMESGVWLPLVLLALFQATRTPRPGWLCVVLAGVALGLSLLAGHPQTSLFTIYLALAFLAYRLWQHAHADETPLSRRTWLRRFVIAVALLGLVAGGLAAVQLLPGLEYMQHTSRQSMSFDDKSNGFPYADIAQVVFPGFITLWSPLYVGIAGIVLAVWAVVRRVPFSLFFAAAALIALGLSFGAGTVLYDLVYLLAPGVSWFRGQERAAFFIAHSMSILAGLGTAHVLAGNADNVLSVRHLRRVLIILTGVVGLVAAALFVAWLTPDGADFDDALQSATFSTILFALAAAVIPWVLREPANRVRIAALLVLIVFDLFSVTMGAPNFEPVPADERLPEPAMVADLRDNLLPVGARVDGSRGVRDNYGSLYDIPDIQGISPLKLASIDTYLEDLPPGRAWDLLAVRYVLTDWQELPVPSTIIAEAEDPYGPYNVHQFDDPRDFAHVVFSTTRVASDDEAYGLLREPAFDTRRVALVEANTGVRLPDSDQEEPGHTTITTFEPEHIVIDVDTPAAAMLTLALPHYPGWKAALDGGDVDILRAYGGLSAVILPGEGAYTLELTYDPLTYSVGRWISLGTLALVIGVTVWGWITARRKEHAADHQEDVIHA
ncbi:MAG: YfhO family protein [Anaerolineae bacterium]|nr:YfhO family protein [Anaerolineae bacterium]